MLRPVREQFARWFSVLSKKSLPPKSRALMSLFFVVVLIGGLFIFGSVAHAQATEFFNGMIQFAVSLMLTIAKVFIQLTIWALKMFILICGYNNYINADVVQLGWNMVRDVANLFFIVILLVIAFGTILGLESYEWRKALGKLIFAALFVNFSNLICQLFIDVAQVFTMTFLNAIAGTAGGNIIKIFNFDTIYNITTQGVDPQSLQLELLGAGMMIVFFTLLALFTIGAYMVVAVARMVVLWVLMILSPLAFVLSALPQGKSYADEFWARFTNHVLAAPVMVFFLWLAFATLGNGNIVQENIEPDHPLGQEAYVTSKTDINNNPLGASFSEAASWENMANFAVAIAFLMVGIGAVQKLGVVGGHLTASALNFAKNVATIATGISAARWLSRGVFNKTKAGIGLVAGGLYKATLGHTAEIAKNFANRQILGFKNWVALEVKPKVKPVWEAAKGEEKDFMKGGDGNFYDLEGKRVMQTAEGKWVRAETKDGGKTFQPKQARDIDGKLSWDYVRDEKGQTVVEEYEGGAIHGYLRDRHRELIKSRKNLEKVENELKTREGLMDKRVTAIPRYGMQAFEGGIPDAMDRWEQGQLEGETERSAAKTKQFKAEGKYAVFANARFKDGSWQADKPIVIEQIGANLERAAAAESQIGAATAEAKKKFREGKVKHGGGTTAQQVMEAKISGELRTKAAEGEAGNLEQQVRTAVVNASVGQGEQGAVARAIAAEKQAHTESTRQDVATKGVERAYIKGAHGAAELAEEALLHATMGRDEAIIKEAEAEANRAFADSDPGRKLTEETNAAKASAEAAENFLKNINNTQLHDKFNQAWEKMRDVIKKNAEKGGQTLKTALDEAAKNNPFIRAMKANAELGRSDMLLQIANTRAQEAGKAGYVEIPYYGEETPTAVLTAIGERLTKDLASLEAPAAAALATKWIMKMTNQLRKTGYLADDQKAVLFSAMGHIQNQAQTDDTMGEMVRKINLLDSPEANLSQNEVEELTLVRDFLSQAGVIKVEEGKSVRALFGPDVAAALQNMVVMSGNTDAIKVHTEAARVTDELTERSKQVKEGEKETIVTSDGLRISLTGGQKANYNQVLKEMFAQNVMQNRLGSTLENKNYSHADFQKALDDQQEFLQEATSNFKRAALNTTHVQNGGHQIYDASIGKYRMATLQEAKDLMEGELRKRKGKEVSQIHALTGQMDLDHGVVLKVDQQAWKSIFGDMNTALVASKVLQRNREMLMNGGVGKEPKMIDGYAALGGGKENTAKAYEGGALDYLKDVVLPALLGNAEAFKLIAREAAPGAANAQQAENGHIRLMIEGDESIGKEGIKADKWSKFINSVVEKLKLGQNITPEQEDRLRQIASASQQKENNYQPAGGKGGKGGKGAPPPPPDEESSD